MAAVRDAGPDVNGASRAEHALAAWRAHDAEHALHVPDRDAIRATDAARSLVLDLLASGGSPRDLYSACARLGRLLADAGASPSLVVSTIDGAASALAAAGVSVDPSRIPFARASVAEGYFAVVVEGERVAARRSWEWPACAVRVAAGTVAIAAGHPSDDVEVLADWAARVALSASKEGYKRALVAGTGAAEAELKQALALVGIEIVRDAEPPAKSWLSFLRK